MRARMSADWTGGAGERQRCCHTSRSCVTLIVDHVVMRLEREPASGPLASCGGNSIVVPTFQGKRGNPVLWPANYFDDLVSLNGDVGAKVLLTDFWEHVVEIEMGEAVLSDIDTPADLLAANAQQFGCLPL